MQSHQSAIGIKYFKTELIVDFDPKKKKFMFFLLQTNSITQAPAIFIKYTCLDKFCGKIKR